MQEVMYTDYPTVSEMIAAFEELTYEKFMAMKGNWLRGLHITWLI